SSALPTERQPTNECVFRDTLPSLFRQHDDNPLSSGKTNLKLPVGAPESSVVLLDLGPDTRHYLSPQRFNRRRNIDFTHIVHLLFLRVSVKVAPPGTFAEGGTLYHAPPH